MTSKRTWCEQHSGIAAHDSVVVYVGHDGITEYRLMVLNLSENRALTHGLGALSFGYGCRQGCPRSSSSYQVANTVMVMASD